MEKENSRVKTITKIPLPLYPLPPLPLRVISKATKAEKDERPPLKTIVGRSDVNIGASCSTHNERVQVKRSQKVQYINTKNVTIRQKDYSVSNYVYEDIVHHADSFASDDEVEDKKHYQEAKENVLILDSRPNDSNMVELKKNNAVKVNERQVTPAVQGIEHNVVKNIKKSLKRPHSRELQKNSPPEKLIQGDDVKRRLTFREKLENKLKTPDYFQRSLSESTSEHYAEYFLTHILTVERKPLGLIKHYSQERPCIVNWLIGVNGGGGNPATVQVAFWYYDSFIATKAETVPSSKLQLVAAACYWIAQKHCGPIYTSKKLVKMAGGAFTVENLLMAERYVLRKLEFPIQPVVPQDFISYLSWWCHKDRSREIELGATFICMTGMMIEHQLRKEYPSVIAVAAVKNALILLGKGDMVDRLMECPLYIKAKRKSSKMAVVSRMLRRALCTLHEPQFPYKTPWMFYDVSPHYVASSIMTAVDPARVQPPSENIVILSD